jgi:AraC-like DNA-binding protein
MDEIDESPGHEWSIPEMAAAVHLSRQQFNRRFINVAGVAPMQYVIRARVGRAKMLLMNTSMTVSQVADALGYSDIYYFSRQFRKEVGVSPSEHRVGRD